MWHLQGWKLAFHNMTALSHDEEIVHGHRAHPHMFPSCRGQIIQLHTLNSEYSACNICTDITHTTHVTEDVSFMILPSRGFFHSCTSFQLTKFQHKDDKAYIMKTFLDIFCFSLQCFSPICFYLFVFPMIKHRNVINEVKTDLDFCVLFRMLAT